VDKIISVVGSASRQFLLTKKGEVFAKGQNQDGELGTAFEKEQCKDFQHLETLKQIILIWATYDNSLALDKKGNVFSWGNNEFGQNGRGERRNMYPARIKDLPPIKAIAAGHHHSIALDTEGTLFGWGRNENRQIDGSDSEKIEYPREIHLPNEVEAISAGGNLSMALDKTGSVYVWGQYPAITGWKVINKPALIPGLEEIVAISCGGFHMMALNKEGKAYRWGWNIFDQMGFDEKDLNSTIVPMEIKQWGKVKKLGRIQGIVAEDDLSLLLNTSGEIFRAGVRKQSDLLGYVHLPEKVEGVEPWIGLLPFSNPSRSCLAYPEIEESIRIFAKQEISL